jgi:DNA repair exonuclease SbcCD ATPase subunit
MIEQINLGKKEDGSEKNKDTATVSIEDISKVAEDLRNRIAEAQRQKEENIEKQLSEIDRLRLEQKNNDELILEAQNALNYFDSLDQASLDLLDEEGKKQLEGLKEAMNKLQDQRKAIDERMNAISDNTEVFSKIHDLATAEDKEFEEKKQDEEKLKGLKNEIDELLKEAEKAWDKKNKYINLYENRKRGEASKSPYEKLDSAFHNGINMAKKKGEDLKNIKEEIKDSIRKNKEFNFIEKLSELRKQLGIFSSKDKAAIDYVINNEKEINDGIEKVKEYNTLQNEIYNEDPENLGKKYKDIISRARQVNIPTYILNDRMEDYCKNEKIGDFVRGIMYN